MKEAGNGVSLNSFSFELALLETGLFMNHDSLNILIVVEVV